MSEEILKQYGITGVKELVYNPSYERLYDDETFDRTEGFERGY